MMGSWTVEQGDALAGSVGGLHHIFLLFPLSAHGHRQIREMWLSANVAAEWEMADCTQRSRSGPTRPQSDNLTILGRSSDAADGVDDARRRKWFSGVTSVARQFLQPSQSGRLSRWDPVSPKVS
jgi:hypothetical protein